MSLLKSGFAGIGTASGVAWPFFGLIVSIFVLTTGGGFALALGAVSAVLFVLVSIPVFYWTYQHFKKKEDKLAERFIKYSQEFSDQLSQLIAHAQLAYQKQCETEPEFNQDFYSFLKRRLKEKACQPERDCTFILEFMAYLKQDKQQWLRILTLRGDEGKKALKKNLDEYLLLVFYSQQAKVLSASSKTEVAFTVFTGAFGSVAGFCSGFSGLLYSMGLFAGFGSFPVLGLGILVFAIGVAISAASLAVAVADGQERTKWLYKTLKTSGRDLQELQDEPLYSFEKSEQQQEPPHYRRLGCKAQPHRPPEEHSAGFYSPAYN
ncbi:hypothetical protein Lbir_0495 [Legionella birminghamensis]|uniref:Uncharacterized protein n=1 Tax=Legionella birminghamensis TaxID=28083 RepID=A0A378ID01_9GAMM|nr:hypothetical protein [Legionella birminghamensis]KTC75350.1 hypothetical protein Lbir_0495 [Legionella birminghamensis]STX33118.1 Uncharacterised protein [Legionella birminghamensis]